MDGANADSSAHLSRKLRRHFANSRRLCVASRAGSSATSSMTRQKAYKLVISRRRFPLMQIKASARLDLLARVISTAASRVLIISIPNPVFLGDPAGLALPEKHDPGGEQPTSNEGAHKNEEAFPGNHGHSPVGNRAPDHRIQNKNQEKMERADEKKPGDPIEVAPEQLSMGAERFTQTFVVQYERNLHRTKNQNERAHKNPLQWQIIEHVGHIHEISE